MGIPIYSWSVRSPGDNLGLVIGFENGSGVQSWGTDSLTCGIRCCYVQVDRVEVS